MANKEKGDIEKERKIGIREGERGNSPPTAPNKSFIFPATPPGPGGTCFPGMPVTLIFAFLPLISTRHSSKWSRSYTAVKGSEEEEEEERCDLACGVVMMGRSVFGEGRSVWWDEMRREVGKWMNGMSE